MGFLKNRKKKKAILAFKYSLRRHLSDDWGNKKSYRAAEVISSVKNHYPEFSDFKEYAVYIWSNKKIFDQYCHEVGIKFSSKDLRKEISEVKDFDKDGLVLSSDTKLFDGSSEPGTFD